VVLVVVAVVVVAVVAATVVINADGGSLEVSARSHPSHFFVSSKLSVWPTPVS